MPRHVNIPIFIPHEGCKNSCVFCDQRSITGTSGSAHRDIRPEIETALSTVCSDDFAEIAFFGGSFTGIGNKLMTSLLDTAYEYVKNGKVRSIRLSTRPDYIDRGILDILKTHGVTDVELGIQSMVQSVLDMSRRGHTVEQTRKACALIKEYGFNLVGQMMTGLPGSSQADEVYTAQQIVEMGADGARIYPTVVFRNTELCNMAMRTEYTPLTNEDAVKRSAAVYAVFDKANVKVLRIGLCASEQLSGSDVYAGVNHPALGELVLGEYYYEKLCGRLSEMLALAQNIPGKVNICIHCSKSDSSKIAGQKSANKSRMLSLLSQRNPNITDIKIIPADSANVGKFIISAENYCKNKRTRRKTNCT